MILDAWEKDPEFAKLPPPEKRRILTNYFDKSMADDEFKGLPGDEQTRIRNNFLASEGFKQAPPGLADQALGALKGLFAPGPQPAPTIPNELMPSHVPAPRPIEPDMTGDPGTIPIAPAEQLRSLLGAGEAGLQLASVPPALAGGGLAALGATIAGKGLPEISSAAQEAAQGLTYQPRSEVGQQISGAIAYPFEKLHEVGDELTKKVYEQTDSPFLAALVGSLPELAPALLPFIKGRAKPAGGLQVAKDGAAEWSRGQSVAAELRNIAREKGTNSPEWEAALNKYVRGEEFKPAAEAPRAAPEPAPEPMAPASQYAQDAFNERFMRQAPPEPQGGAIPQPAPRYMPPPEAPSAAAPVAQEPPFYPPATARPAPPVAEPMEVRIGQAAPPMQAAPRALPAPAPTEETPLPTTYLQESGDKALLHGELIHPRSPEFQRLRENMAAVGEEALSAYRKIYPRGPVVLGKPGQNIGVIIAPSTKEPGKFQVTRWDDRGFSGDTQSKTEIEAVKESYLDGYRAPALQRFETISKTGRFHEGLSQVEQMQREHWKRMTGIDKKTEQPPAPEPIPAENIPAQVQQPETQTAAQAVPPWKARGQEKSSNPEHPIGPDDKKNWPEDQRWLVQSEVSGKPVTALEGVQTIILSVGPTGSGKTSLLRTEKLEKDKVVNADADALKKRAGWGSDEDVKRFHEPSSETNKIIRDTGIDEGKDVIYDSLGKNYNEMKATIERAKKSLAKVKVLAMDVDLDTSISRALQRRMMVDLSTGAPIQDRKIDFEVNADGYNKSIPVFKQLLVEYFMDPNVDFKLFDNSVDGRPPVLIIEQKDGIATVGDEKLFDRFRNMSYGVVEGKGGKKEYVRTERASGADVGGRLAPLYWRAYRSAEASARKKKGNVGVRHLPDDELAEAIRQGEPARQVHDRAYSGRLGRSGEQRPERVAPPTDEAPSTTAPPPAKPKYTPADLIKKTTAKKTTPAPTAEAPPSGKAKQTGSTQKLVVPNQRESVPVRFAVMETADVIPSHNPMNFARNPKYPAEVQERLYHSDREEQAKVISRAQGLKTNLLLNTNPDAMNGPPIVTPDGVVLGGNSRAMIVDRAYREDAQHGKGSKYKDRLARFAGQFGLDSEAIKQMDRPQLVRVFEPPDKSARTLRRLASDFNKSPAQGMSQEARTVSMGKNVDPKLIEQIGDALANTDKSIREYLETKGIEVLDKLIKDGVIPGTDRNQYYSAKYNKLNDAGKDVIEKVLVGSVIDDADLLTAAPKMELGKIGRALPDIVKVKARGESWDITPQLKQALEVVTLAKSEGNKTLKQYYAQQGLPGEPAKNSDPAVRAIAEKLWSEGLVKFANLWKDFARDAAADIKKQTFLFAPKTAEQAFKEVFGGELNPPSGKQPAAASGATLFSGIPIPAVSKFMGQLGDLYTRRVGSPIWDRFIMGQLPKLLEKVPGGAAVNRALIYDYRGDLPMTDRYIESMEDMQRGQASGREYAIDLGKRLQALPEDGQMRIGEAIRGELDLGKIGPVEGHLAMEAIRAMTELGRQAVDAGLLGEETYFKNVGKYMPRLYTSKEYQGLLTKYGLTKPNRLDLSRFKKRKDIPKEIREEMGEILTPGYPVAKGITQMTHDIELAKFFNGIADTEEWSWTRKLPKEYFDEVRADLLAAKKANSADEVPLEEIVALVQKAHPEALIDIREDAIGRQRVVIENGKPIPEGFKQLPKNVRLGRLSEAYVHPEIFNDLNDAIRIMGEGEKALRKGLAAWKFGKVVASPKTHVRNMMSNSVLAHLGGLPMYEQPVYLWKAAAEIKKNGEMWKQAKDEGLLKSTFTHAELRAMFDSLPELGGGERAEDMPAVTAKMQAVFDVGRKITGKMAELYEFEEQWFKMAKFIYSQERNGMTPKEAAVDAQKWLFDYSKVTRFQGKYRQSLFGAPFATFTFKALPRIAEAVVKTPWRFAVPAAIILGIEEAARRTIQDSKEEREAKKKLRPDYMQTRDFFGIPNYVRWPFVDEYGREHYLNLTYILPWGDIAEGGDFMGIPGSLRPMSHPVTNELAQQIMNFDAFKKDNIVKDEDLAGRSTAGRVVEEAKIRGKHLFSTFAPTPALDVLKGYESLKREPDYRGRVRDPRIVAADAIAGVKIYPVDYAEQMQRKISKLDPTKGRMAQELKTDIRSLASKKNAVEKRGESGEAYQKQIDEKIEQMKGMAKELGILGESFGKINRRKAAGE